MADAIQCFGSASSGHMIVDLVCGFIENHRLDIWLSAAKLRAFYEKHNLLSRDGSAVLSVADLSDFWVGDIIHSLSISAALIGPSV
ncbi:hypothetical protein G9A89_007905 [Geosiphon pyriformis]|nr:hypothetical protein G9A89_007905 [Geosiphon pyriformis]